MTGPSDRLRLVLDDFRATAAALGVDVRVMPRRDFLRHGQTGWKFDLLGTYNQIRQLAASEDGEPISAREPGPQAAIREQLTYTRKLERQAGRVEYYVDKLSNMVADTIERNPIKLSKPPKLTPDPTYPERAVCVLLSDLHIGVDVCPEEVLGSKYNAAIAARRIAKVVDQAARWKRSHRKETELHLILNGDLIHGRIHLQEANLWPISQQLVGVWAILVPAIDYLRHHFARITVHCTGGNHDRYTKDRQISQRWDTHAETIFRGLAMAFRADDSVVFDIPRSGISQVLLPGGHLAIVSHGDVEPTMSNVGRSINMTKLENRLARMNTSGAFDRPIEVSCLGHFHQPAILMVGTGATIIVNGSTMGGDGYGQNGIGVFNPMPAQVMWEAVPGYPCGDVRVIQLRDADDVSDYDAIVPTPVLA